MATTTQQRRTNRKSSRNGGAVPQPTAAPAKSAEEQAAEQAEKEWAELVKRATEGDSSGARQVARAIELEQRRATLMQQINDNRTYLRMMDRNEELNEDQSDFVDVFYPEKEKGARRDPDEVEATRKAREAARKDGKK